MCAVKCNLSVLDAVTPIAKLAAERAAVFMAKAFLVNPPLLDSAAEVIWVLDELTLSAASDAPDCNGCETFSGAAADFFENA